jgi:hypothetical protein
MVLMKIFLALMLFFLCSVMQAQQTPDPLKQVAKGFPKSITLKNKGRLIEFCPDNTCDGFVGSKNVSAAELKSFAYLYVYYFSDFTYLEEWRSKQQSKSTAEHLLARSEFKGCKESNLRNKARCSLLFLSRNDRIKLIFIRYDEGARNVVPRNIAEELAQ